MINNSVPTKYNLHEVPTSYLLNEAYRRGAVRRMKYDKDIPLTMLEEYSDEPEYIRRIQDSIIQESLLMSIRLLYQEGVLHFLREKNDKEHTAKFSVDYFICKHPLTLKRIEHEKY